MASALSATKSGWYSRGSAPSWYQIWNCPILGRNHFVASRSRVTASLRSGSESNFSASYKHRRNPVNTYSNL